MSQPGNDRSRRQLSGQCVEKSCAELAAEGSDYCSRHRDAKRARDRAYVARRRARRVDAGQCVDCGKRTKLRRCPSCYAKSRRGVGSPAKVVGGAPTALPPRGHYKTETFADGSDRKRFVGLSHRGGPTRAEADRGLVRLLADARSLLDGFLLAFPGDREAMDSLPRIQRTEAWDLLVSRLTRSARLQLEVAASLSKTWRQICAACGREHDEEEDE